VYAAEHMPHSIVLSKTIKVLIVINSLFKIPSVALVLSLAIFGLFTTQTANAAEGDTIARLNAFVTNLKNFSSKFEQTRYGAGGDVVQSNLGTAYLKRPNQFVWRFDGEGGQELVSDGKNFWLYDKELVQITVQPLGERVNGTPMVALMGVGKLEDQFTLSELGQLEGIDWVKLIPREAGADFESIFIGLKGEVLAAMELRDSFGQATQIRFSDFKPNIDLSDDVFLFVPPEGVDVMGEPIN